MTSECEPVKVAAVGDIFPGDHYFSIGHGVMSRTQAGTLDPFSDITATLRTSDIAIGNLEGALSSESSQNSSVGASAFRGVPSFADLLRCAGFTHINIANNHIMQHGIGAFHQTIAALRAAGITPVGLRSHMTGCISEPAVGAYHGKSVCIVGYSQVPERYSATPLYAHFNDSKPVVAEISRLAKQYDYVIVSCHAGEEGTKIPAPYIVSMYNEFAAAGASCILGHHSHIFQPIMSNSTSLIAYSLGNFVFDLFWDTDTIPSAILEIDVGAFQVSHRIHPTRFTRAYRVEAAPAVLAENFRHAIATAAMRMTDSNSEFQKLVEQHESLNKRRKYLYFLSHIARGSTGKKLDFLARKLTGRL